MSFFVICPHCQCNVEILQVNCAIFRHGVFKHNNQQIPPHAPKVDCENWVKKDMIHGCGKPFQVKKDGSGNWIGIVCEYI